MTRTYGRSVKGNRVYETCPYKRETNLTLIGAISLSGFTGIMTIDSGTSKNVFQVFIEQVLLPNLWPGACLVMDNLPAHKVQEIRNIIEEAGIKVIYLSPYSPEFNPIENCWSNIIEYLPGVAARTRDDLEIALRSAIEQVTLTHIRNWFTHCCYCTSPSPKVL